MKKSVLVILFLVLFAGCKKESNKKSSIKSTPKEKIERNKDGKEQQGIELNYDLKKQNLKTLQDSTSYINHYYLQFDSSKDSISEVLFFEAFPNNFKAFNRLYGYSEQEGESPLYNNYHLLNYDAMRKNVADVDYYKKIIELSKNAKWEADNIGTLQEVIVVNFIKNPKVFLECLKQSEISLNKFWYYFFDSPHPEDSEIKDIYNKTINILKRTDSAMIPIIKKSYLEVKKDWSEH